MNTLPISIGADWNTCSMAKPQSRFVRIRNDGGGLLNWAATIQYRTGSGWLTLDPPSGIGNATIRLDANAAGLTPGIYEASVLIDGGPLAGAANLPVRMEARELAPKNIHVVHFVLDGGLASSWAKPTETGPADRWLDPDAVAQATEDGRHQRQAGDEHSAMGRCGALQCQRREDGEAKTDTQSSQGDGAPLVTCRPCNPPQSHHDQSGQARYRRPGKGNGPGIE